MKSKAISRAQHETVCSSNDLFTSIQELQEKLQQGSHRESVFTTQVDNSEEEISPGSVRSR